MSPTPDAAAAPKQLIGPAERPLLAADPPPPGAALVRREDTNLAAPGSAYIKKAAGKRTAWRGWAAVLLLAGVAGAAGYWFTHRPAEVTTFHPVLTSVTETIASSGLVGGVKESVVGASFDGAIVRLLVRLGDHVRGGETLAVLKNSITQAQVTQAEAGVETARTLLKQASRGPLDSEIRATQMQVSQAQAVAEQATSELTLARQTQARMRALATSGAISTSELDTSTSALAAAEAKSRSGAASIRLAEAQLQTLRATPRQEDVELANDRLTEARQYLLVVRQQANEATVTAPFSGTITAVNAEVGQNVGTLGLFGLASDSLEIRIELDESNLADISLGQEALLSAAAFPGETFTGRLKEISPAVNRIRGTVSIKLTPIDPPAWLRTGQTLNANLVTNQAAQRLLVPATALRRSGDRTVVLVLQGTRVLEQIVLTRPPTDQGVPVLAGLTATDLVVVDPLKIRSGDTVRIRK